MKKEEKTNGLKDGTGHYYIDKKKIYKLVCDYKNRIRDYDNTGKLPQPDNDLIYSIYKMINRELGKPNYRNYTFHDEMRGLAIIDCLRAIDLFDPSKSENVFSYFWGTIQNAFKRVIIAEKRQIEIRNKLILEKLDEITNDPDIEDDVVRRLRDNTGFDHIFKSSYDSTNEEGTTKKKTALRGRKKGKSKSKNKFTFS